MVCLLGPRVKTVNGASTYVEVESEEPEMTDPSPIKIDGTVFIERT